MGESARFGRDGGGANVPRESGPARFGPVQVKFNDDGTLAIYQPDSNRALSAELAKDLVSWLAVNSGLMHISAEDLALPTIAPQSAQSTVGGGVISTSDGPSDADIQALTEREGLTETEVEADKNADSVRPPVKRRPWRPRKAQP